jgi:hypothetical protein
MLEVEHAIAACIEEYAANVGRVVHAVGSRDIYLRDGSRIVYRWELPVGDWRCLDCSINTDTIDEYYSPRDEVWAEANPDGAAGTSALAVWNAGLAEL